MRTRTLQDAELAALVTAGDADAFGSLFDRHCRTVYNFCFRRTASWHVAEDLTAVVFLEAWRNRARFAVHEGSALPWLYGIALNVCRNQWRSSRRRRRAIARLPLPEVTPDHADSVAARVDDERRMAVVLDAVAALPDDQRDVVALVVWEGLDYESAAATLGVPVGTVRSRLSRARACLRSSTMACLVGEDS